MVMAGPVQPHPLGSGTCLQGFSRIAFVHCFSKLLFLDFNQETLGLPREIGAGAWGMRGKLLVKRQAIQV